ncbi:MAG TPA: LacI family DNA-binding transcriptional regulator [Aggregatilineales bacterium]|nr:LacI family DNA-binding transcriptional regulator [Aggregatilineales bacterium]
MKKLTINQIAKLAEVSKGTVSKVLNNYPHVSDEMRERVMKVVNQTGFERNHVAQVLASSRSNIIGLIIPSGAKSVFSDPYFPQLTECITRASNGLGLTLSLLLFYSEQENISATKNIITNGLLDGVILSGDRKDNEILPWLIRSSTRFVFLGRPMNGEQIHFVDVDNFGGGKMATDYLIDRGHQKIGIIGCNRNWAGEHRYEGYCAGLVERGIGYNPDLVTFTDFSMEGAYHAMKTLIKAGVDAVFVTSDTMALGALKCIREHGLTVPEDIALIGFDDLPVALQAEPQLTTIRQPIQEQSNLAVETLLTVIETPTTALRQVILPTELIIRGTTK